MKSYSSNKTASATISPFARKVIKGIVILTYITSEPAHSNPIELVKYFPSATGTTVSMRGGYANKFWRFQYEVFSNNSIRLRENGLSEPRIDASMYSSSDNGRNEVFSFENNNLVHCGQFFVRDPAVGEQAKVAFKPIPLANMQTSVNSVTSSSYKNSFGFNSTGTSEQDFIALMNGSTPTGYTTLSDQKSTCTVSSQGVFAAFDDTIGITCRLESPTYPAGTYVTANYWFAKGIGLVGYQLIDTAGVSSYYSAQPLNNNDPIVTPPGPSNNVETGWYWDPATSGRGWFVERQGSKMFVAGYLYGDDGKATWLAMPCDVASDLRSCNGTLDAYQNGQTLTGPYRKPSGSTVGQIKVTLAGNYATALTWPGGTVPLQRFSFDKVGPYGVDKVKTGWYWNADESGQGWSVEVQGGSLFVTGYLYDDAGKAVWYLAAGGMTDPTTFEGTLSEFANGQTLTGPYKQPVVSNSNVGAVKIKFRDSGRADMTIVQGSKVRAIGLTRFNFGG